jgi:hypothetical protein
MKIAAVIATAVLFALPKPVRANDAYYDKQEQIRRDAEKLVEFERRNEEAAKRRYDQAHPTSSPDGGGALAMFGLLGLVAAFGFGIWKAHVASGDYRPSHHSPNLVDPVTFNPTPSYKPKRQKLNTALVGELFVNLIGEILKLDEADAQRLIGDIQSKWDIEFAVDHGQLNITQTELERVAVYWHEIRPYCEKHIGDVG